MPEIKRSVRQPRAFEVLLCCILFLLSSKAACGAGGLSLDGYYKSYLYLFQPPAVGIPGQDPLKQPWMGLSSNRLRLHLSYRPQKRIDMDAAYDIVPRIQSTGLRENLLLFEQINAVNYRAADLDAQIYPRGADPIDHFVVLQNLDRASITLHTGPADIIVGRQAIAWGSARVVNPTDVLAPFTFSTLDTEDRIGIDAVRTRIPLGALSEIDAGYVFGRDFKFSNSAFYGRTKFNARKTDISLLMMGFRENLLAGFDLARAIGRAGFWLETAYVFVDALADYGAGRKFDYFRASSGMDYNFTAKTYAFVEYHFNGAGASNPRDYLSSFSKPAYTEGAVYLMGHQYLSPGVTYQISPLVLLTAQSMINLTDPSVYFTPQLEYNIASSVYLGGGAFIGIGKRPVASGGANPVVLRSEFGGYPNTYYGSLRYYF